MTVELLTYSPAQAAEAIGMSTDRVRELCATGEMPARRIGGRWYISRTRLERWLEETDESPRSNPQRHGRAS